MMDLDSSPQSLLLPYSFPPCPFHVSLPLSPTLGVSALFQATSNIQTILSLSESGGLRFPLNLSEMVTAPDIAMRSAEEVPPTVCVCRH